jgi:CRISPR-associated endonuclease/helicase Cas3
MLVVCNTVADARRLTEASPETCYHLSTAMAPAHRTRTLEAVREHLKQGEPVRLVSTQVIEAGVDISFPFVVRIEGPLDGIIQAAGRCNREGEADGLGEVVVTRLKEGGMPPAPYCTAAGIVRHWIESEEEIDPNDPDWCRRFYEALYRQHDRDKYNVGLHLRDLDLKTAADQYRIIDDETTPYVVEAEVPERLLEQARTGDLDRGVIRALQPYLVTLYPWQADEAKQSSFSEPIDPRGEGDLMLWTGPYDDAGIRWE